MKQLNFLSKSSSRSCSHSSVTLAMTVGSPSVHRRGAMLRLLSVLVLILTIGVGNVWGTVANYTCTSTSGTIVSSKITWTTSNATWNSPQCRMAANSNISFTLTGVNVTKVVMGMSSSTYVGDWSAASGSIGDDGDKTVTWEGTAGPGTLTFTTSEAARLKTIAVTYTDAASYTVVWTINPAAGGSLSATSGTSTTVTPTSTYTYGNPAYSVTSGTASVLQSTNTFTATPSANCTIRINMVEKPKYTVTLKDDNSTITQTTINGSITLPSRTGCSGYTFAGWTKSWVAEQSSWTTIAPTIIPAGSYTPTANENLYPVYTKTEGGSGYSYVLTAANTVTAGTYVIGIKSSSGYYIATGLTESSDVDIAVNTGTNVTLTNNAFTSLPTGAMELTFSGNNTDGYTISNSDGNKLSYSSYASRRLSFAATGKTWKVVEADSKLVLQSNNSDGYYTISQNGTNSIRGYASNTKYNSLYLFKKTSSSTTSYISVPNCCTPLGQINGSVSWTTPF